MRDINPYWKVRLFWLFMALVSALLLFGCSPEKIAARKDAKAIDRVLTSPPLLQTAWARGSLLWPCANDTQFLYKPGRVDSIAYPVLIDTPKYEWLKEMFTAEVNQGRRFAKDSLVPAQVIWDDCNEKIKRAFDLGVEVTAKEFNKIKIPVHRPDTLAGYIVDRRMATTLLDTISVIRGRIARFEGQKEEWANTYAKAKDDKKSLFLWLLAAIAALVGTNAAWIIGKIKK